MEPRRFTTTFTSARHLSLSWAISIQSIPPTSNFLKIYLNIIFPSTPGSSKWSLSLRFLHQNPIYASPLPHTRYMSRPYHSSRFYHPNNFGWGVQIVKLLTMSFSLLSFCLVSPRPKYSPQQPVLKHPQLTFLPQCQRLRFTPVQNKRQNYISVYLSLFFFFAVALRPNAGHGLLILEMSRSHTTTHDSR